MTILSGIWVKVSPLVTVGPRCRHVYLYNWQLRLWRQKLGMELTPSQLSKVKSYVQLPRKYINVGSKILLFK